MTDTATSIEAGQLGQASDAMLSALVELIEEQRVQLGLVFAQAALEAQGLTACPKTSNKAEACDRPLGHPVPCSFELDVTIRRYRDAEVRAAKIGPLENRVATLTRKLEEAEEKLAPYMIEDPSDPSKKILLPPAQRQGTRRRDR